MSIHFSRFLFLLFLISWLPKASLFAQNPVIEKIVEDLASKSSEEDQDYSSIVDDLNSLIENPLNINESNVESLEKLHFLSEFQIENILNYLATRGELKTIYELQLIDGLDMETINKMLPFVRVDKKASPEKLNINEILRYGNQRIVAETKFLLQTPKGYLPGNENDTFPIIDPKYQGNKMKYLLRYRFNYKSKVYAGLIAEKDPGEKMILGQKQYGFDYYTFHFQANDFGRFKTIVLGDYQVNFGQGLIIWSGFGLGKSSDAINIRKKEPTLRYYSSTDENMFMHGAASTVNFGKFNVTGFISHKYIDASLADTNSIAPDEEGISNFQNSGYHRTETELKNRKLIGESIFGTKIAVGFENFKAGINFLTYKFDLAPLPSDKPYKLFDLNENSNFNVSLDYTFFAKKFNLFGEAAISKTGGKAILNGMATKLLPQLSFSMLHRYYQKDYLAHYANTFSENSKVMNEQGIYFGFVLHPFRKIRISAYGDGYSFPWLKYGVDAPSHGSEYLVETNYALNRNFEMYFRWRSENRGSNISCGNLPIKQVTEGKKQNFRFHITYQISPIISLRNRIEYVWYQKDGKNEYGFMILQDISMDLKSLPLSLNIRYALFDAPYEARIYAYENDLLYTSSIPAYSGKGNRFYVMLKYKPADRFDIRLRYSQYLYADVETIGSGLDEIDGNLKSEIKFQFVLRL